MQFSVKNILTLCGLIKYAKNKITDNITVFVVGQVEHNALFSARFLYNVFCFVF